MNKENQNQKNESRRSFVQKTALATSALLTMPLGVDAMANVHGEKKLKTILCSEYFFFSSIKSGSPCSYSPRDAQ